MPIKNLPLHLRPREKAIALGVEQLTDIELLALFLRSGNKEIDVLSIAKEVFSKYDNFSEMTFATLDDLQQIKGIGEIRALELASIFEITKRIKNFELNKKPNSLEEIAELAIAQIGNSSQEVFMLFIVDRYNKLVSQRTLFVGQKDSMNVDPKIIIQHVIKSDAKTFYCIHNHPSGDHRPSEADKLFTMRLNHYCSIFDLTMKAHIIVSAKSYSVISG